MPIIKFHVPDKPVNEQVLEVMTQAIHDVCVTELQARPDAVQLLMIPCRMLFGQPVYIEVLYREQSHRDARVMGLLMNELEKQTRRIYGVVPRIRCIAVEQRLLHAAY